MSVQAHQVYEMPCPPAGANRVEKVAVSSLLGGNSPRLNGEDKQHIKVLAETDKPLPPILVHRGTMRVIDGMHRLRVAQSLGRRDIEAVFCDGTEEEAFLLAVKANTEHGLPLTLADREAATARIISSNPEHSDRWIAAITGLANGTVGAIRRRLGYGDDQVKSRIGRDGRLRPVNSTDGRRLARDVITAHPEASLREVARIAGISPGTVRDVRERLRRGADPVPPRQLGNCHPGNGNGTRTTAVSASSWANVKSTAFQGPAKDRSTLLQSLQKDPSLRLTEAGRKLLRWLDCRAADPGELGSLLNSIPSHCIYVVTDLARKYAADWLELADELGRRPDLLQ